MAFSASAQKQGEQYVGLSLGYNTGKSTFKYTVNDETSNPVTAWGGDNLGVCVDYGYFIADNLRVGGTIGYGYYANDGDSEAHALNIMPNIAYYIRLADNFYYTPNLSIGFGLETMEDVDFADDDFTMCGFATEFQPLAVEFRPSKRVALSVSLCSLQYVYLSGTERETVFNQEVTTKVMSGAFNFDLLANAQVGFKLYF